MTRARRLVLTGLAAALTLGVAACGGSGGEQQAPPPRTLTVSAAASLTNVYNQLKPQFEQANPGVTVQFNFGGSDTLAQQVVQGAPADVLATASTRTMQTAQQAGRIQGQPVTYATNTAPDRGPARQPEADHRAAVPRRPAGHRVGLRAGGALRRGHRGRRAGRRRHPRPGVRGAGRPLGAPARHHPQRRRGPRLRQRRESANGQVQGIDFPQATAQGAAQNYLIGAVTGSQNADLANSWIQFVTGPQGDAALTQAGFTLK